MALLELFNSLRKLLLSFTISNLSPILKFEGIQPESSRKRSYEAEVMYQIANCCHRLAKYLNQPAFAKLALKSWTEFFELLVPYVKTGVVILYFEEILISNDRLNEILVLRAN